MRSSACGTSRRRARSAGCAGTPTGSPPSRSARTGATSPRSVSRRTRRCASSSCRRSTHRPAGGHLLAVNAVAVSPDGKTVATAGTDQTIKLWDIATGKQVGTLIGNADMPFALAFLGQRRPWCMGGQPRRRATTGRLHFWRHEAPRSLANVATGEVYTVCRAPDGTQGRRVGQPPGRRRRRRTTPTRLTTRRGTCSRSQPTRVGTSGRDVHHRPRVGRRGRRPGHGPHLGPGEEGHASGDDWPLHVNRVVDLGITADKKSLVAVDDKGLVKVANIADKKREVLGSVVAHKAGVRGRSSCRRPARRS